MAVNLFKKRRAKSKTEDVFNRPLSVKGLFDASPITPLCENQTQPNIRLDKITPCDIIVALIEVLPPDQGQKLVNKILDIATAYDKPERLIDDFQLFNLTI